MSRMETHLEQPAQALLTFDEYETTAGAQAQSVDWNLPTAQRDVPR